MAKKEVRKPTRRMKETPKVCFFCKEKKNPDFLEPEILSRFISERGKILSRSKTGACSRHQRAVTTEIKRARYIALLPFVVQPD